MSTFINFAIVTVESSRFALTIPVYCVDSSPNCHAERKSEWPQSHAHHISRRIITYISSDRRTRRQYREPTTTEELLQTEYNFALSTIIMMMMMIDTTWLSCSRNPSTWPRKQVDSISTPYPVQERYQGPVSLRHLPPGQAIKERKEK